MTLDAIKEAIGELQATEQTHLANWLYAQDAATWNHRMAADFSDGGSASALVDQWDAEIAAGDSIPLWQFLAVS